MKVKCMACGATHEVKNPPPVYYCPKQVCQDYRESLHRIWDFDTERELKRRNKDLV